MASLTDGRELKYVYFFEAPRVVKIGTTKDIFKRFKTIQSASPVRLNISGIMVGDRSIEEALHRRFAGLRQHGEWFRKTRKLLAYIKKHSDPVLDGWVPTNWYGDWNYTQAFKRWANGQPAFDFCSFDHAIRKEVGDTWMI